MSSQTALPGRKVLVGVGGGISAFKAVELVRELGRRGAEVRVVMTPSATKFVGPMSFSALTGTPAVVDLWDPSYAGEVHVELARFAEAIVVAPATASLLARAATGLADDALTATLLCASCPVLYAPAMHHAMWAKAPIARAVDRLRADGATMVGPTEGPLANGETGMGRMAEPIEIADALAALFAAKGERGESKERDLGGLRLLVSAGPTVEDLDPVRFLGNRSTGKMGFAIAERAARRGAQVTLVAGPVTLATPPGVTRVDVRSALEMDAAVREYERDADAIVMSAAVADFRPAQPSREKIKKRSGKDEKLVLELVKNPDILAGLGSRRGKAKRPVLVGFAVETSKVAAHALEKLAGKHIDLVVANHARDGFGGDDDLAMLVTEAGIEALPRMSKRALADVILDRVSALIP